jgi:hypothetical protein
MASRATGSHKGATVNATEPVPQKSTVPNNRDAEVIALLQKIVELLDDIDGSLANIGGTLDSINRNLP